MVPLARLVVTVLACGLLATVPSPSTAGAAPAAAGSDVVSRKVVFEVLPPVPPAPPAPPPTPPALLVIWLDTPTVLELIRSMFR